VNYQPPIGLNYEAPKKQRNAAVSLAIVFLPLALSIIEIPWYCAVIVVAWSILGDPELTRGQTEILATIAVLPAAIGMALGAGVISWLVAKKQATIRMMMVGIFGLAACCAAFAFAMYGIITG
jgi:hypothetical protein